MTGSEHQNHSSEERLAAFTGSLESCAVALWDRAFGDNSRPFGVMNVAEFEGQRDENGVLITQVMHNSRIDDDGVVWINAAVSKGEDGNRFELLLTSPIFVANYLYEGVNFVTIADVTRRAGQTRVGIMNSFKGTLLGRPEKSHFPHVSLTEEVLAVAADDFMKVATFVASLARK